MTIMTNTFFLASLRQIDRCQFRDKVFDSRFDMV
jgi:hypothetical protein